jgi:hypothetical protein
LTPIPTTAGFDTKDKDEIKLIVTSPKMVKIIDDMARDMTEQTDGDDYNTVNDPIVSGKEEDKDKDKETNTNSGQSSGDGGSELNIDDLLGGNKE